MTKPLKVFIGFDPREQLAFDVCCRSLKANSSVDVEIIPLKDWELRRKGIYWRAYSVMDGRGGDYNNGQMIDGVDGRPFSTQFSFTRFLIPHLEDYRDEWVAFFDCDTMWRGDIAELFGLIDKTQAVMCVKHNQAVTSGTKMDGVAQVPNKHGRKNWSSLMLLNPSRCQRLTRFVANNSTGEYLHALLWADEEKIGSLPKEWNHLVGCDEPNPDAKMAHFTMGSPDIPGWGDQPFADEWFAWARSE